MNASIETILYFTIFAGLLSIIYGYFTGTNIIKLSPGNNKMQEIATAIQIGAKAYLNRQYKTIAIVGVVVLVIIIFAFSFLVGLGYLIGATLSGIAGYVGMLVSVQANVRTAEASRKGLAKGLSVAFKSGAITGMLVAGLALLSITVYYFILLKMGIDEREIVNALVALGFGASLISIFARLGGGIFTKGADVGADLVGKVEAGIPEDDPRNPAVIADNVGDNVGDVAGMGADLFGSCAESTCAALVIGAVAFATNLEALLFPILISAVGIPVSLIALFTARVKEEKDVAPALKRILIIATGLSAVAMYFVSMWALPESFEINGEVYTNMDVFLCYLTGAVAGLLVGLLTEYYTSHDFKPVQEVAKASETGAATNIIFGLALGYHSATGSILLLAVSIYMPFTLAGMYGVAVAAIGMLSTLVVGLTIDAYGPVADNAGGIAEMAGMGESIRDRTDVLDSAGNTTAAIGKGFAIGSAILTSLALFSAFLIRANLLDPEANIMDSINLLDPLVLTGLFVGAMLPFLFSAMTMKSVGKAAFDMIEEVRRQFRSIPGIMEGTAEPDYEKCVAISTEAALREMIPPGILIMGTPLLVGFLFGVPAVAGILAGSLVSGGVLAISSANSGGAWDNAKKYIEKGNLGGKGTETHKAAVVGDTVGDPFKDTSGPSLNILIKLSAILSLVFVPFFIQYGGFLTG